MQKDFNLTTQKKQELSKSRRWNEEYFHSSMQIYFLIEDNEYDFDGEHFNETSFSLSKSDYGAFYDGAIYFDGFNFKYYLDDNQSENMHQFFKDEDGEEPLTAEETRDYLLSLGWIEITDDSI